MVSRLVGTVRAHPPLVWALWGLTVVVVVAFPALLSDPALWMYLLDPELLALIIIIGLQMAWPLLPALRSARRRGRRVAVPPEAT
jgi:hypothetical protein